MKNINKLAFCSMLAWGMVSHATATPIVIQADKIFKNALKDSDYFVDYKGLCNGTEEGKKVAEKAYKLLTDYLVNLYRPFNDATLVVEKQNNDLEKEAFDALIKIQGHLVSCDSKNYDNFHKECRQR